ncbi:hypothetical protein AB4Z18_12320 [Leifsonia sp. 2TAF2]|uniref:hypothetical protein n=1 Tax=Leifsonia sp. 2TAF2 TaxID=3233009 RepID=UPI003F9440F5
MGPNEAAELLGVSPSATRDEVQHAYDARLADAGVDDQRRDALTAARDALLAASAWQAPGAPVGQQVPQPPTQVPPQPYAQPTVPPPGYAQQQPYPPAGAAPGAPNSGPWYPPAPPRRGLSTGAIVGITLGSVAVALVVLLIAVISIVSIAHSTSRLAAGESSSSAAPFDDPSDQPSDQPSDRPSEGSDGGTVDDYDVDGVHVHYVDGWTFELTSDKACVGALVTVGFADTTDGGTMDVWSTVVDLPAGESYELTVPDDASDYDYAGIDSVSCTQT